ncbi:MAG: hypothetical protein ACRCZ2_02830 [Fusobacteriaceae bacterium]
MSNTTSILIHTNTIVDLISGYEGKTSTKKEDAIRACLFFATLLNGLSPCLSDALEDAINEIQSQGGLEVDTFMDVNSALDGLGLTPIFIDLEDGNFGVVTVREKTDTPRCGALFPLL